MRWEQKSHFEKSQEIPLPEHPLLGGLHANELTILNSYLHLTQPMLEGEGSVFFLQPRALTRVHPSFSTAAATGVVFPGALLSTPQPCPLTLIHSLVHVGLMHAALGNSKLLTFSLT